MTTFQRNPLHYAAYIRLHTLMWMKGNRQDNVNLVNTVHVV